ncbi:Peptidase A1 domain-containing protein [Aphelenchoides fujianensis]|nr:Peptidase A1 domain-containing protein [Aphelenchoides fujianensis]
MRPSSFLVSFFAFAVAAAVHHRLPLFKQKSSVVSKKVPNARHITRFSSLLSNDLIGRSDAQNDPGKSDGYGFAVHVQLGTPARLFYAEVELDQAELWIADKSCQYWTDCDDGCLHRCHMFGCEDCCNLPDHCRVELPYDSSLSSSYRTDGEVWNEGDGLSGIVGYDAIAVDADVSLPVGGFVQVTSLGDWATPFYGACQNISGKIGLALAALSPTGTASVFEQAFNQGLLEKPLVGLWMNRSKTAIEGDVVGELTFGEWDHEKCGETVVFVPIAGPEPRWTFWVDGAQIGNYELGNAWRAVLDLKFTGWSVPEQLFKIIVAGTNSQWDQRIYQYVVDCKQDTPLTLTTDGGDLVIPLSAFSRRYDANTCVLDLYYDYDGKSGELIFGSPFFASFCGVFDYEKQQFGYAVIN